MTNNFYLKIAQLSGRLAKLPPEQYQLLEKILQQESVSSGENSNIIYDYYNSLANQGGWLDYDGQENYEQTFLTFGPFPQIIPDFSWILTGAYPEKYHQYVPLVLASQKEMRDILFAPVNFSECQKVLDFGCGYGSDLITLGQKYPHLILNGYTLSSEQAKVARKKVAKADLENQITIFNRDSAKDVFPVKYDVVFGFEVAHHIKDKGALFSNIGEHLNDQGFLVLADFISNQSFAIEHEPTSSYFITSDEWNDLLKQHHLKLIDVIDISQEIANFLNDENFEKNLEDISKINQDENVREAFQSYNQLGKLLRKRLASYVLLTAQKQEQSSPEEIYQFNQQKLKTLTPYAHKSLKQGLYQVKWQITPLNSQKPSGLLSEPSIWLIFADNHQLVGRQLAKRLESEGDRCICIFPGQTYQKISATHYIINPLKPQDYKDLFTDITQNNQTLAQNVVHLWSLDHSTGEATSLTDLQDTQNKGCGSVLYLVRVLIQGSQKSRPRLWLITQGAKSLPSSPETLQVQQAPLWGLGQVINLEHPDFKCTNIDWGTPTNKENLEELYQELKALDQEQQIIWRNGDRFVARLVRYFPQALAEQSLILADNSSYLITGGLGALGLKLAQWLVNQGARHLVLMGRSEASTIAKSIISQLEQAGTKVLIIQGDVSNADDVKRMLSKIKNTLPPLQGIIHAAGIIDDGTLMQLSWDKFQKVMAAKIAGSWNLHQQTQDLPIDFFVCFSSMTSFVGNAGQANYAAANSFMDELTHHRHALGLPGLTINWGPWAEVGMAAQLDNQTTNLLAAKGIGQISPDQGLQMLGQLITQGVTQMGVMPIDWTKFLDQFPPGVYPPLFSELAQQIKQQSESSPDSELPESAILQEKIQEVTGEKREQLLITYLQKLVSKFLGLSASSRPSPNQPLNEMGLDSLVSIQLRNRIRTDLDIELPMKELTVDITIAQIVLALQKQFLLEELLISETPSREMGEEAEEEIEEFSL